jgi:acyl-CoA synthetase (AMP-forming)/AMP-acid ligase II
MNNSISAKTVDTSTLVDLLCYRALLQANRHAYTFLRQGESEEARLMTYGDLDQRARAIATLLQSRGAAGKPVLLLHPPGLQYIAAFFGCLYAGAIAVPAYPPRSARAMPRIQAIVADTEAKMILTTAEALPDLLRCFAHIPELESLAWVTTNTIPGYLADKWQKPEIGRHSLAFLQYTSGSTAAPKGVMITHGNLLHNLLLMHHHCEQTPESHMVSWLPPYHDMGLIGSILFPLYEGFPSTLMSPLAFLHRPFRWLQAITRTRATISVAPNFAYELCVRKITPEQRATLDLSSWTLIANGAEQVRDETMKRFVNTFAACGVRPEAFFPCYGLAEATLMVTSGRTSSPPVVKTVTRWALEKNQVADTNPEDVDSRKLVGYDRMLPEEKIVIVNPETLTRCSAEQIGEVWIAGPSVAHGYWNKPEESQQTFQAYLADTGDGPFLRTGDLGFLMDNVLFITGRIKDMIIVRGRNHYPHDIELTVEQCHPAIRPGCCAALSVDVAGREQLVILAEIEPGYQRAEVTGQIAQNSTSAKRKMLDGETLAKDICWKVWEEHDLQAYKVMLVKAGSIPKTSSGKIQRRACRAEFLTGRLEAWDA